MPVINLDSITFTGNNYPRIISQLFLDTVSETGPEQQVIFPARGTNTLDLSTTNRSSLVDKVKAVPGVGNHDIVFVQAFTTVIRHRPTRRKILLWNHADIDNGKYNRTSSTTSFLITLLIHMYWHGPALQHFQRFTQSRITKRNTSLDKISVRTGSQSKARIMRISSATNSCRRRPSMSADGPTMPI